ncbi:hypothetical protein Golob_024387 [Gossypium lobatum]|uniref:Retrotransposon gag domain-containing protein n=1 Tax=Gossypium lobatum TaxID=34289 RepID=A0A7J8NER0_9ROSI|nr:hypothetical protein [Gossypium lobatum]
MDVPKLEKFKSAKSTRDVDNFLWVMESTNEKRGGNVIETSEEFQREFKKQFYPQYAEKEARAKLCHLTQQGTVWKYVRAFSEQGITELTIAIVEAESFVELGLTKDKFESSKANGKGNGERNHEKDEEGHSDDGYSIDSISGNRKPRDAKQGSNSPRDKRKRIKCFICQGPHMEQKCPKKSIISTIK